MDYVDWRIDSIAVENPVKFLDNQLIWTQIS